MKAFILAGGLNRRFPYPKGLIKIGRMTIIERLYDTLKGFFDDIYLITNSPEIYFSSRLRMFGDLYDFRCPLTGIFTALKNSDGSVFITSCDMPFVKREMVELLLKETDVLKDYNAIVPVYNKMPEPLFGIYSPKIEENIRRWIMDRRCNMREFIDEIDAYLIDEDEIQNVDNDGVSFININTPQDLEEIKKKGILV